MFSSIGIYSPIAFDERVLKIYALRVPLNDHIFRSTHNAVVLSDFSQILDVFTAKIEQIFFFFGTF